MFSSPRYGAVTRPIPARLAPALLTVAATLLLGAAELPFAPRWRWFESEALLPVTGLVFAGAAGLLACHLAQLSAALRPTLSSTTLPAALAAAALPGVSPAALLVPLALAVHAALRRADARLATAAAGLGIALATAALWLPDPALHLAGALAMLGAAALEVRRAANPADNDNVRDEPPAFWSLPQDPSRARQPQRTSSPVLGE